MMKEGQSQSQVVNERDLLYGFVSDFLTGRLLQGSIQCFSKVGYGCSGESISISLTREQSQVASFHSSRSSRKVLRK